MKKVLIVIFILIIGGGVFYLLSGTDTKELRCEDGFRFVPSTQSCESIDKPKEKSIDFSKVIIQIPETGTKIELHQVGDSTKYTGKQEDSKNVSAVQFISLDSKEVVQYSEKLALIPFIFETGGTGSFVYIGLLDTDTNTLLSSGYVGDRISLSSLSVVNEKIKVNFKTRLNSESFATQPTIPAQIIFEVLDTKIIEIIKLQNAEYSDIEIKSPMLPIISSEILEIKGAIPGSWYFEANAQFKILDVNHNEIALGSIQALSDWMTIQRVPFELKFSPENLNYKGKATVIIQSENVQGDEEGEKLVKKMYIPAEFK